MQLWLNQPVIESMDKKATMRVVSQMYHVLLPLWFRRSHTRKLNTLFFIKPRNLVQSAPGRQMVGSYRATDVWLRPCLFRFSHLSWVTGQTPRSPGLGRKWSRVSPWWRSAGTACPPHAFDCKARAVAQWGIEAEAILWRGLRYAQVDWRGRGGVGVAANSQCLGAVYAKRALAFKQPAY